MRRAIVRAEVLNSIARRSILARGNDLNVSFSSSRRFLDSCAFLSTLSVIVGFIVSLFARIFKYPSAFSRYLMILSIRFCRKYCDNSSRLCGIENSGWGLNSNLPIPLSLAAPAEDSVAERKRQKAFSGLVELDVFRPEGNHPIKAKNLGVSVLQDHPIDAYQSLLTMSAMKTRSSVPSELSTPWPEPSGVQVLSPGPIRRLEPLSS